jgi:hypothetical protein
MKDVILYLKERQIESERYWEETYPDMRPIYNISGAEPMDNMSWELGFYEGLQYALDQLTEEE